MRGPDRFVLDPGRFILCRREVAEGRGENRRWGLSSSGCASGYFRDWTETVRPVSLLFAVGR